MENNEYGTGRKDWMEIFEPSGDGGTLRSNNSIFTPPANCKMKGRDFKGACTSQGYGPVNAPKVTSGGGFTDYGPSDPVSTGPSADGGAMGGMDAGGGGMGESINEKFISFLESMATDENADLIETVKTGYITINEAKDKWAQGIDVKEGKMTKLLNIPKGKKITDVYTSGKKLAEDLLKAVDGDKKKASSMLAFAANVDKTDNVLDTALRNISKDDD